MNRKDFLITLGTMGITTLSAVIFFKKKKAVNFINNDAYFGRSEKIKYSMKNHQIPESFPKASINDTKFDYKAKVKQWAIENRDLLKPQAYDRFMKKVA